MISARAAAKPRIVCNAIAEREVGARDNTARDCTSAHVEPISSRVYALDGRGACGAARSRREDGLSASRRRFAPG